MKKFTALLMAMTLCIISFGVTVNSAKSKNVELSVPELKIELIDVDTFTVSWNKVSGAKGYELFYSTDGKSYKKLVKTEKRSHTHTNLEESTKYYYKVRAYKNSNGKMVYGKYSKVVAKRCTSYLVNFCSAYESFHYFKNEYTEYKNGSSFKMGGKEYTNGFSINKVGDASAHIRDGGVYFNLDGKYSEISFIYGCIDGRALDSTIKIYLDDECVDELAVNTGDLPKTKTIDIQHAGQLKISVSVSDAYSYWSIAFADVKLYK